MRTCLRRLLVRRVAMFGLVAGASACEAIFADNSPQPLRVSVNVDSVTAQFFAAGDTVDGSEMPRSGVRVTVPITYTNRGVDTLWLSGCGPFGLVDKDGMSPAYASCMAITMTPRAVPPLSSTTEVATLTACNGTAIEHWSATYPCFVIWHEAEVAGRFRVYAQADRQAPGHYWSYTATSNSFVLVDPR